MINYIYNTQTKYILPAVPIPTPYTLQKIRGFLMCIKGNLLGNMNPPET